LPVAQVLFTQPARADIAAARDWYESQASGLGERFLSELDTIVERLASNGLQFPIILRDVRRARLHSFPYGLFFRVEPDAVMVIACFPASRNPGQWQRRLQDR